MKACHFLSWESFWTAVWLKSGPLQKAKGFWPVLNRVHIQDGQALRASNAIKKYGQEAPPHQKMMAKKLEFAYEY